VVGGVKHVLFFCLTMLGIIGRDAKRIFWDRFKPPMIGFVVVVRIVYYHHHCFFCTQQKQTVLPMVSAVFPEKVLGSCNPPVIIPQTYLQTEVTGGSIGIIGIIIMFIVFVY
jgi:hypothetical protein